VRDVAFATRKAVAGKAGAILQEGEDDHMTRHRIKRLTRVLARPAGSRVVASVLLLLGVIIPDVSNASASYTYDQLGRLVTAVYDNGLCIAYAYDMNGNRTSISTVSTTPQSPTWGSGAWGCFNWTPH
jgi:YD repeat-containing protein